MLMTVSLMVAREPPDRRNPTSRTVGIWFLAGGLAGGTLTGLALAGGAAIIHLVTGDMVSGFALAAAVTAVAYVGPALSLWRFPKPGTAHQVPAEWREMFPTQLTSFVYAAVLGMTFFTRISSLAVYPFVVLTLGLGQWPLAIIALFALAGLIRAGTALVVPVLEWIETTSEAVSAAVARPARLTRSAEGVVLLLAAVMAAVIGTTTWL